MDTGLFQDIENYPHWALPLVNPKNVAVAIAKAIQSKNPANQLSFPSFNLVMPLFFILRVFPLAILWRILTILGIDDAMINIRGKKYGK